MFKNIIAIFLLSCLLVTLPAAVKASENKSDIIFITIGQYAGQLNASEAEEKAGLARFAAALKKEKINSPQAVLVSTGNMLGGTPESELTMGAPLISAFNSLRLDIMAIGAEDLKWPEKILQEQAAMARYTYLGLDEIKTAEGKILSAPYKLIKRNGVKLGFLAINKKDFVGGVLSADTVLADAEKLQSYVTQLQNEKADIIILVTDIDSPAIIKALLDNIANIAIVISDIDINYNGTMVNDTFLLSSGLKGQAYGQAAFSYDTRQAALALVSSKQQSVSFTDASDTVYESFVDRVNSKVSFLKQQELGKSETELWHNPNGVSLAGQFITDTISEAVQADVALLYGDEIGGGLRKGNILQGDLYQLLPADNEVMIVQLTGKMINELINNGLENNSHGIMMYSGLKVCYDDNKLAGSKTAVQLADGTAIAADKIYRVAISGQVYRMNMDICPINAIEYTGKLWRDYIFAAIENKRLNYEDDQRLTVIPKISAIYTEVDK